MVQKSLSPVGMDHFKNVPLPWSQATQREAEAAERSKARSECEAERKHRERGRQVFGPKLYSCMFLQVFKPMVAKRMRSTEGSCHQT